MISPERNLSPLFFQNFAKQDQTIMNIAHIWKDDYPWDVRVEKISKALIDDGHHVHLICKNNSRKKTREEIDKIQIHRLYPIKYSLLNSIYSIVAFFNPVWIGKIWQIVRQEKIDVLLVRDLPLVISALIVGKICKVPVVFDMAENYPSMWKDHVDKRGRKFLNHLTKNHAIAELMENYVLPRVDHTIVVVEESKDRLIQKGGIENKITVVSNTPDLAVFEDISKESGKQASEKLTILYVGALNGGRGLDVAIRAVPLIKKKLDNFELVIIGEGEYKEELQSIAAELGITDYISFLGWIDSSLVPSHIHNSDICIVPHDVTDFINSTIPNKIFDYMACKKPIITSDATPFVRIINENRCGLFFKSRNSQDFADKVIQLNDASLRKKMGNNGFEATRSKYNWGYDTQILTSIFEHLEI